MSKARTLDPSPFEQNKMEQKIKELRIGTEGMREVS